MLSQWASGARPIPLERCTPIELATDGKVTRKDLRPDDWQAIWPELAEAAPASASVPGNNLGRRSTDKAGHA